MAAPRFSAGFSSARANKTSSRDGFTGEIIVRLVLSFGVQLGRGDALDLEYEQRFGLLMRGEQGFEAGA